jgi:DNA polymerase III epsilon subunit family exonuclease
MKKGLSVYNTTSYTDKNIEQAKSDLEELKAIKKKLSDKKDDLEKSYSLPIEEVSKQLEELIEMVKEPYRVIDKVIKEHEKSLKKMEIMEYAKKKAVSLGEYSDRIVKSKAFFDERWLNKSYKEKDWKADIDKKITDASDNIRTIKASGGKNKSALLAFYLDKLSLDGSEQFIDIASGDVVDSEMPLVEDEDKTMGYMVLKVYGTQRQLLRLMTQLEFSDIEVEEIEDGMPKTMKEISESDFDSFVAFDIEHTGTWGFGIGDAESEIMEIGAVKVKDGKIIDKFDMLANPKRKIIPKISRLTNITDEMVANEPPVSEVIKKFKEFVGDDILVGHNIKSCDIPHITRAAKRAGVKFDNEYFDTLKLARSIKNKKGWDKLKLQDLAKYYHIEQSEAHRAWCDAETNALVFLELKKG